MTITKRTWIILASLAVILIIGMYGLLYMFRGSFPIVRGHQVEKQYSTYWFNPMGYYYISVDNQLQLINHGTFGYLSPFPDLRSFTVLNEEFAKDKHHVWYKDELLRDADAATFRVDPSGLGKDKYNIFIFDLDRGRGIGPACFEIDVESAEYFVFKNDGQDWTWVRDKDHVFLDHQMLNVDRDTFGWNESCHCFSDKNGFYETRWDGKARRVILVKI